MSMGRAIVTTDAPGCRETVRGGENGFLVPVSDSIALADAMERVLTDPALSRSLGERGYRRADAFRWNVTARQTLDVLRRVAA